MCFLLILIIIIIFSFHSLLKFLLPLLHLWMCCISSPVGYSHFHTLSWGECFATLFAIQKFTIDDKTVIFVPGLPQDIFIFTFFEEITHWLCPYLLSVAHFTHVCHCVIRVAGTDDTIHILYKCVSCFLSLFFIMTEQRFTTVIEVFYPYLPMGMKSLACLLFICTTPSKWFAKNSYSTSLCFCIPSDEALSHYLHQVLVDK
mmetsp:Transcript_27750/g.41431  ORF Transcript_27750/g.41431 Transcript_27750/m.41431 type:complete len:202 (+) Transcript_27750:250-855(+)